MKKRSAFSMIELVFVIVIIGIIGKFGVEFLAQAYKSFIYSSVNNTLQSNSTSAVELIASRLENRIKDSVIARSVKTSTTPIPIASVTNGGSYTVLEWVGADDDGFRGRSVGSTPYLPSWSGIIDIQEGDKDKLVSPMTNTSDIDTLIKNLSNNTSTISDAALFFVGANSDIVKGYGWDGTIATVNSQQGSMHPITSIVGQPTQFQSSTGTDFSGVDIYEYYKLAWSAYAIVYEAGTNAKGTLRLYYNYQPWLGENFNTAADVKSAIIMENVSTFRFLSVGSIIKIQVCVKSDLVEDYSLCKEKTVL